MTGRSFFRERRRSLKISTTRSKTEVIHSLEGLQKELTGLYSSRQFKLRYRGQLSGGAIGETYAVMVFTLEELDTVATRLGHEAAQEAIRSLGVYLGKHFGAIGGFSTRHGINEYVTVLPASDLAEAEGILKGFIKEFQLQEQGILDIWAAAQKRSASEECVALTMLAGLAQGQPSQEIESVIELAKHQQKVISRVRCITRGEDR